MKLGINEGAVAVDGIGTLCRKDSGTEYVSITFALPDGSEITTELYWTDKTKARTRAALKAMGWQGEVDRECHVLGLVTPVSIGIKEEEYNGRLSTKVDWVGQPFGGVNEKDRLSLANAKSMILDMRQGFGVKPSNGRRPETGVNPDPDDRSDAY